ncbi:MAG: exodeoxyribonuclease VII small subunit [Oscillospiraceae bacterium]|jgi:exodeoxyribonuclease VII small subunit|nr:exodeoxyribonuclease VII small subunit [Oscillospiraceae bacterium]MDD3261490.1 exodeoxyribonuclease VII small subunit [Oscillospiraceae bacterium]
MNKKMTFEQAMDKLAQVVQQLESASAPLDKTMKLYQEGVELTAFCYDKLQKAEQKMKIVTEGKASADTKT